MESLKKFIMFGMFLLVMLSFISFGSAFGIAVSYWDPDNPLRLEPGDSADISFRLQNIGGEDLTLRAELVEGGEIATIIDESLEYFVPAGSEGVKTNIRIRIPEGTPLGTRYKVAVDYIQIADDEGEMVQVAAKIVQNIPVVVGTETLVLEEPQFASAKEGISPSMWIVLGVLVALVIAAILYFRKKKKK